MRKIKSKCNRKRYICREKGRCTGKVEKEEKSIFVEERKGGGGGKRYICRERGRCNGIVEEG